MKREVSATALLSMAIALLAIGIDLIEEGQHLLGVACAAVGALLVFATVLLVEKGIVGPARARQGGGSSERSEREGRA